MSKQVRAVLTKQLWTNKNHGFFLYTFEIVEANAISLKQIIMFSNLVYRYKNGQQKFNRLIPASENLYGGINTNFKSILIYPYFIITAHIQLIFLYYIL